jgi:hypothetical protein
MPWRPHWLAVWHSGGNIQLYTILVYIWIQDSVTELLRYWLETANSSHRHTLSAWEFMGFEPKTCRIKHKGDHLASMTGFVRATGLVRCLVIGKPQRAYVSQNMILRYTVYSIYACTHMINTWKTYFVGKIGILPILHMLEICQWSWQCIHVARIAGPVMLVRDFTWEQLCSHIWCICQSHILMMVQ